LFPQLNVKNPVLLSNKLNSGTVQYNTMSGHVLVDFAHEMPIKLQGEQGDQGSLGAGGQPGPKVSTQQSCVRVDSRTT